ncbi:Ras guanine-nucleotide exchange factors catalytic domain [Trypanosoma melophagium]|uniref:Ras guanine-nucleotide exchange factors catalytic domain n=1 Tax=Trypanosoma melophagium TaxID=715481 RepID=UPI00351A22DB|nr:Ras guanine-nucleotide exchange factors catalytic domain [Trypanosoma melophagium]
MRTHHLRLSGFSLSDDDDDDNGNNSNNGSARSYPDKMTPSMLSADSISETGRSQTVTNGRQPVARPGMSARTPPNIFTSSGEMRQYQISRVATTATTTNTTIGNVVNSRQQQSLGESSDDLLSIPSAAASRGIRGTTPTVGGGGGGGGGANAGITMEDVKHAVELQKQQCYCALSTLRNSSGVYGGSRKCVSGEQLADGNKDIHDLVRGQEVGRGVNEFVASFLSANGYKGALELFKKRLPLAEQQLQGCLHYHNQQQEQQKRDQQEQQMSLGKKSNTHVKPEEKKDSVLPSPTYAFTKDDLLLFVMERVRQQQMLNDTLPWREINCRSKDYRLEPLEHHQKYRNEVTGTGGNAGNNKTKDGGAVGGSLDLLIEVLILAETDTPFTIGMPIFNYTNIFILLSSLFVLPEVLIVRLIRLFRHIQQHLPVNDSRCVFLQRRILQFIIAYCKFNEADITYTLLERLECFLQSCNVSHSPNQFAFESLGTSRSTAPILSSTSKLPGIYSTIAVEVNIRLNELSAFIEDILQKKYTVVRNNSIASDTITSWQNKLTTPVKPLGTLLFGTGSSNETYSEERVFLERDTISSQIGNYSDVVFTKVDVETLSNQMCLLSFRLFTNIHLRELLNNAWCDEIMRISVPYHLKSFIDFFSHLQRWITVLIVSPKRWSECQSTMQHVVHFCRLLYEKQNFEAAAAVLAGLQDPAVCTLEELYRQYFKRPILDSKTQEIFSTLQASMDPFASTESPSSLRSISSRMSAGNMEAPMIPLLAPLLGVLFRTEESRGKTVEVFGRDKVPIINWSKIVALAKTVFIWLRCQNTPYNYPLDHKLQFYLWRMPGHQYFNGTITNLAKQERVE